MHMADALLNPGVAGTMYACSALAAGYSVKKLNTFENKEKIVPVMGVMGAFVFSAQMINFTIPGTGSSGHLCGGMLLSAIVGPEAGFLTMIGVLLIQCLLFADGGLLALGANIWNMAFYGCFIAAGLLWKHVMKNGMSKKKITAASILGCVTALQLGAFSVCLETMASGITELPFSAFISVMLPIHLAIGLIEGLITAAVLCFVYEARPELLWQSKPSKEGKLSYKNTLSFLVIFALITAGLFSLFASAFPDGLEWSIAQLTGDTEISGISAGIYALSEKIQNITALLPDYSFQNTDGGTSFSGLIGACIVIALFTGIGYILKHRRHAHDTLN